MRCRSPLIVSLLAVLALVPPIHAGPIQGGGTYTLAVTNFPGNLAATPVTLDGAIHPFNTTAGQLNLQATIYDVNINTQWLDFAFSTPSGPLASNANANWSWTISNIPTSEPALLVGVFYYWSIDGNPIQNIKNWQGGVVFPPSGTNPFDAAQSPGFGGIGTPIPIPVNNTFFVNPFNLLTTSTNTSLNLASVNDFHFAFLITAANPRPEPAIPEPASLIAWGVLALVGGLCWMVRGRDRRALSVS